MSSVYERGPENFTFFDKYKIYLKKKKKKKELFLKSKKNFLT